RPNAGGERRRGRHASGALGLPPVGGEALWTWFGSTAGMAVCGARNPSASTAGGVTSARLVENPPEKASNQGDDADARCRMKEAMNGLPLAVVDTWAMKEAG